MAAGISIRDAQANDLSIIFRLIKKKAQFDGMLDSLNATEQSLEDSLFASVPSAYAVLSEIDGVPVGLAIYYFTFSTFNCRRSLWLDDLFVEEPYRSHGIGERLLKELALIAVQNDCCRIDWITARSNSLGLKFYCRHGAELLDEYRLLRLNEAGLNEVICKRP